MAGGADAGGQPARPSDATRLPDGHGGLPVSDAVLPVPLARAAHLSYAGGRIAAAAQAPCPPRKTPPPPAPCPPRPRHQALTGTRADSRLSPPVFDDHAAVLGPLEFTTAAAAARVAGRSALLKAAVEVWGQGQDHEACLRSVCARRQGAGEHRCVFRVPGWRACRPWPFQ